jgi:magnesium-transporting ATPase (P-type)
VEILWDQFSNVMLIMLLAVAAVSAAVSIHQQEFPKDAIAILVIVVLNGLLGYLQESKAQQALLALRDMAQPLVQVRRDGAWERISSELLVPGDLIRLEAGDRVPADGRLLEDADLGLREAALTGEAEAVFKKSDLVLEDATPVLERKNCLFQGTEVVRGRGVAVVTATGMATVRMARMVSRMLASTPISVHRPTTIPIWLRRLAIPACWPSTPPAAARASPPPPPPAGSFSPPPPSPSPPQPPARSRR